MELILESKKLLRLLFKKKLVLDMLKFHFMILFVYEANLQAEKGLDIPVLS